MANTRAAAAKISKTQATQKRKHKKSLAIGAPRKSRRTGVDINAPTVAHGVVPGGRRAAWQSLPYEILLLIFKFAAYPLVDESFNRYSSVYWLVNASTVCKVFCEPALSALLDAPPITSVNHVKSLCDLVQQENASLKYRSKVHQLNLQIEQIKLGKNAEPIEQFISHLSALKGIGIHSAMDEPGSTGSIGTGNVRLIHDPELRWARGVKASGMTLTRLHISQPGLAHWLQAMPVLNGLVQREEFSHITSLSLSSMSPFGMKSSDGQSELYKLSSLARLSLYHCTFLSPTEANSVEGEPIPLSQCLPPNLVQVSFIQCYDLVSEAVREYLQTSGRSLRKLELRHNVSLDLRFISQLATSCPKLETFCYDLSLFSAFRASNHHDPDFDAMLKIGDVPIWPSKLESLELVQLRNWGEETAAMFFKSLMDSAPELNDLRRIHITASVGAGWRERASFRENVIGPIYQIFARPRRSDPAVNQRIVRKEASQTSPEAGVSRVRRSARTSATSDNLEEQRERDVKKSVGAVMPPRRSRREIPSKNAVESVPVSETGDGITFIHGRCDYVHVRVDNQRPAEEQLNETNFLDSEPSGDEAWDPSRGDIEED